MSSHKHKTECLSPYTRDGEGGPTPTTTQQDLFAQRLRGVLSRINARTREAIIEDDLFGLRDEALVDDPPEEIFETRTTRAAILGFLRWLRNQLDNEFLEVVGESENQFIRKAYAAGIRNIHTQLSDVDATFARPDMNDLLGRPLHRSELQQLYTRVFENLQSVRDDVAQAVRDELVDGFAQGENPTKIARRLTDRVNSIGKHRATMIARSEVINAYSTGSLTRIDELNQDQSTTQDGEIVTSHGTWDAAMGQPNTCPFCRAMNGTSLTTSEMAGNVVRFRGDTYRLKPPAHPQGRCNINIRISPNGIDTPLNERLPAEVTLIT